MGRGRITVTPGFLFLMAVAATMLDRQGLLLPALRRAALLHELGHLAAIRRLGGSVRRLIGLTAVGAEIQYWSGPCPIRRELAAALAGPAANLAAGLAVSAGQRAGPSSPG